MPPINWIKTELGKHFEDIRLDEGVDLNQDGKLEGSELTDLNNDKIIDLGEWQKFLNDNEAALTELGGFFKYYYKYGKSFKPTNPFHDNLAILSELVPKKDIIKTYKKAESILNSLVRQSPFFKCLSPEIKIIMVYRLMQDAGLKLGTITSSLITQNIISGVLDCDTSSMLVLALAHEMHWPVYLVFVPRHAFVRWNDGANTKFNVDGGYIYPDTFYMRKCCISAKQIQQGLYLKNSNYNGLISHFYTTRGQEKCKLKDYYGAADDFQKAVKLNSKNITAHSNLTAVKIKLGDNIGAIKHIDQILALGLADEDAGDFYFIRAIANRNELKIKEAREDFKKAAALNPEYKWKAKLELFLLGLIPAPLYFSLQPRLKFADDNALDMRFAAGGIWPLFDISNNVYLGPNLEIGYGTQAEYHFLDVSAGIAFVYGSENLLATVKTGVGYNFLLAGEPLKSPISNGTIFQYSAHFNYKLTDSFSIGASLALQHEMNEPSNFVLLPGVEFNLLFL